MVSYEIRNLPVVPLVRPLGVVVVFSKEAVAHTLRTLGNDAKSARVLTVTADVSAAEWLA